MKIFDFFEYCEKLKINPISISELDNVSSVFEPNKFGITRENLKKGLKDFPLGVVVKMLEETIRQEKWKTAKERDIIDMLKMMQINPMGTFYWADAEEGHAFWQQVIHDKNFDEFFKRYPEYKKYN